MKKLAILLLLATALSAFAGCNTTPEQTTDTTVDSTTEATTTQAPSSATPSTDKIEHNVTLNADLTSSKVVVEASDPTTVEMDGYSMVTSGAEWSIPSKANLKLYKFVGSGDELVDMLTDDEKNPEYARYYRQGKVVFYRIDHSKDEVYKKMDVSTVKRLKCIGAAVQIKTSLGRLFVYYQELDMKVSADYSSVTAPIGQFIKVSFHTTLPVTFNVSLTKNAKSTDDGYINHKNLVPTQAADGSYVGTAKFTVPYTIQPGQYYINIISGNKCHQSIPITVEEGSDPRNDKYHLMLAGDWDLIKDPNYQKNMEDLFYNVYPRLIARWGVGSEPKVIIFYADVTYDGVAYAMGNTVTVATNYANQNPHDIGFFSHELTHNAQQYDFKYGDDAWWTENMATYGGFRYFHWADANYIQLVDKSEESVYYWPSEVDKTTYGPYGNGCKWFFAYMDYHWPTTQDENGNRVNGLIDTINFEIKQGRLKGGDDNPTNKNNMFNKIVKEVTGYDCMEDIRKKYAEEFKSGAWDFKGFADYEGHFMTENLPNVVNPVYPMLTEKVVGDKTAAKLETPVTTGENLALGATIPMVSGQVNSNEAGEKLVDGKLGTKWCSTSGSAANKKYSLDGTAQWIVIDLGEATTFNTYTIYNTKWAETGGNTTEWEILISDDMENWVSIDYQKGYDNNEKVASFNVGEQTARYILLKGYTVDNGAGTIRLYEFQLYNVQ